MSSEHKFLVMWCIEGLECLIDITQHEQENVIAALHDQRLPHTNPIQAMILRARYNTQRHYEIYYFVSAIRYQELKDMFETNPQVIVEAIRSVGSCLYSDRQNTKKQVIF